MESLFLNPSLVMLGLPLLALPIIIHLINLMRHRRVKWAAMEFLLAAYKKSRTWVILKQLLLLLMRIAALAAIMLIVAQPLLQGGLDFLGGEVTHHIVLLDDTYSTSDTQGTETAYEIAKRGVMQIAGKAAAAGGTQEFTVLRYSEAANEAPNPDVNAYRVAADFETVIGPILGRNEASQTSVGPEVALDALDRILDEGRDETRIIYLVSDFRQNEWEAADALRDKISLLRDAGAQVKLIRTADQENDNLSITALEAERGTRAARVPIRLKVTVKNNGKTEKAVTVTIKQVTEKPGLGVTDESTSTFEIQKIAPGAEETRVIDNISFDSIGAHWVQASIPADAILADNDRYWAANVPAAIPVLVCDDSESGRESEFLRIVLESLEHESAKTGLAVDLQPTSFLSDHNLSQYAAIYVTGFGRMEDAAVTALEEYVQAGGGVAFYLNPDLQKSLLTEQQWVNWVNESLYREGEGLFPVSIASMVEHVFDPTDRTPHLLSNKSHFLFNGFGRAEDNLVGMVFVHRFWALPRGFEIAADAVLCHLHTNAQSLDSTDLRGLPPLIVENRSFGEGRVVVHLVGSSKDTYHRESGELIPMTNWQENPAFIIMSLKLQDYISRQSETSYEIGAPFEVNDLPIDQYGRAIEFERKGKDPATETVSATAPDEQAAPASSDDGNSASPADGGDGDDVNSGDNNSSNTNDGAQGAFLPTIDETGIRTYFTSTAFTSTAFTSTAFTSTAFTSTAFTSMAPNQQDQDADAAQPGTSQNEPAIDESNMRSGKWEDTGLAGVYRAKLMEPSGASLKEVRIRAYNVDPAEGRLDLTRPDALASTIDMSDVQILSVSELGGAGSGAQQSNASQFLLYALVALLIGEQILAYSASYHTSARGDN